MSTFSDAKTYADLMLIFDNLSVQLDASRRALRPMPDLDARQVALRGMQEVLAGYAFGFSSMVYDRTQEQIIRSFGRTNVPPNEARRMVEDAWKNGLLVLFMFKVDVLLQNLAQSRRIIQPGYWRLRDDGRAFNRPLDAIRSSQDP